jgi:hypothetical protein
MTTVPKMKDDKKKGLLDMLGSGMAHKAGQSIMNRQAQIDSEVMKASGGSKPKKAKKKPY